MTASLLYMDGRSVERSLPDADIRIRVDGAERKVRLSGVLSLHMGAPASDDEARAIKSGLSDLAGEDLARREAALARLAEIGLPVVTPLLAALDPSDTDAREPAPLYRLFARLIPAGADRLDRSPDLVRMADGTLLRGAISPSSFEPGVRRIAVRRPVVERVLDVQSLHHSTQTLWMDTGVELSAASNVRATAEGITRLSFDLDKWTATPDGLIRPDATGQKRVIDGFNFGALLFRVGGSGARQLAGSKMEKSGLGAGRLFFAVNDNGHWQNNVGSYKVRLRVTNAYDVGDPS